MKASFFRLFVAIPHLFLNHKPCGSHSIIHSFLLVAPLTYDFFEWHWYWTRKKNPPFQLSVVMRVQEGHCLAFKTEKRGPLFPFAWQTKTAWRQVCVCVLVLTGATSPQRFTAFPCHLLFSNFTWCLVTDPNVKCICARVCGHVGTGGDRSGSGSSYECVWVLCSWWHVWCERVRRRGSEWANNRGSGKDKAFAWHTQTHTHTQYIFCPWSQF